MALSTYQIVLLIVSSAVIWNTLQGIFVLTFSRFSRKVQYTIYILLFLTALLILSKRHWLEHLFVWRRRRRRRRRRKCFEKCR